MGMSGILGTFFEVWISILKLEVCNLLELHFFHMERGVINDNLAHVACGT